MQRFELFFQFLSALECGDDGGVVRNQEALRDAGRKGKRLFNAVYFEFEPVFFLPEDFHASEAFVRISMSVKSQVGSAFSSA